MCLFIALGPPERHRATAERCLGGHAGFKLAPVMNPYVRGLFPERDAVLWVTDGHCSCDILPSDSVRDAAAEEARRRAEYRRLGWSEAKIERAIEASRAAAARRKGAVLRAHFQSSILALVKASGHVRLLVHDFSGLIETEVVGPCERVVVPVEDHARGNGGLALDVLVEITLSMAE